MSTKYHISATTGNPNKCYATNRPCPVGGDHFSSREAALKGIEKAAKAAHATVAAPLKKAPQKPVKSPAEDLTNGIEEPAVDESTRAEKFALTQVKKTPLKTSERFAQLYQTHCKEGIHDEVKPFFNQNSLPLGMSAPGENDGCSGCEDYESDESCNCFTYDGNVVINSKQLVNSFYTRLRKPEKPRLGYTEQPSEVKEIQEAMRKILYRHGLLDPDNYVIHTSPGYYGEEFDGLSCLAPWEEAAEELAAFFGE